MFVHWLDNHIQVSCLIGTSDFQTTNDSELIRCRIGDLYLYILDDFLVGFNVCYCYLQCEFAINHSEKNSGVFRCQ